MKKQISAHNSKILRQNDDPIEDIPCNCSDRESCPVEGQCNATNVIYQATVTELPPTPNQVQNNPPVTHTYVGLTASKVKTRLSNHTKSINNRRYSKETKLSIKIWQLKDQGLDFELKWKILERAQPFSPISGVCGLCTLEKWYIIFKPEKATLNKREEIAGHCFHRKTALLKNS